MPLHAVPMSAPRGHYDVYDEAVQHLAASGFVADVREMRLDATVSLRTVAVYVSSNDPRLLWSLGPQKVPLGFHYRGNDRHGHDFTLFSGISEDEVSGFVQRLTAGAEHFASIEDARRDPRPEWDPYALAQSEKHVVDSFMGELDELMANGAKPRRSKLRA